VIGTGPGANSRVIFADRGSTAGVRAGMAVVNADGIVGRVTAAYPAASQIVLVTDPGFAAGVISAKNRVQGTLKGPCRPLCKVDYLQNEEKVEVGEWFYTSGEDRIFPRGVPVGQVTSVGVGNPFKEVLVAPSGLGRAVEEVLIVLEGVHQLLPEAQAAGGTAPLLPPPPAEQREVKAPAQNSSPIVLGTDADRLLEQYKKAAESQGRAYGDNTPSPKPAEAAPRGGQTATQGAAPPSVPPPKPPSAQTPARPAPVKP
jgi:rod shape-determining protein MreC